MGANTDGPPFPDSAGSAVIRLMPGTIPGGPTATSPVSAQDTFQGQEWTWEGSQVRAAHSVFGGQQLGAGTQQPVAMRHPPRRPWPSEKSRAGGISSATESPDLYTAVTFSYGKLYQEDALLGWRRSSLAHLPSSFCEKGIQSHVQGQAPRLGNDALVSVSYAVPPQFVLCWQANSGFPRRMDLFKKFPIASHS